jgi:hypothetical protein
VTDWIDMEFLISEIESAALRNQLIAVRFETTAEVYQAMAAGAAKAAEIFRQGAAQ